MNCSNVFSESLLPWKASACVIHQTIFKTKMTSCHKKPSVVEVDRLKKWRTHSEALRELEQPTLLYWEYLSLREGAGSGCEYICSCLHLHLLQNKTDWLSSFHTDTLFPLHTLAQSDLFFFKGRFIATCFHNKQTLSSWFFCPTCIGLFQALLFTRKSQEFKDVVYVTMKKSRSQSTVQSLVPHSLWPSRILDMIAGAWCRGEKIFILNLSIIAQTSWRRKKKVSSMTWEKTDIDHTQWQTWGFSVI